MYKEIKKDELIRNLALLSGIKEPKLREIIEKYGLKTILDNPKLLKATEKQTERFLAILETNKNLNEIAFLEEELIFDKSWVAKEYYSNRLKFLSKEVFEISYLNNNNKLIYTETLFKGTIGECTVYPREVVERVLLHNSTSVIIAHNHPAGTIVPSKSDLDVTKRIKKALDLIDVKLLDHIIVGKTSVSFREDGLL